MVEKGENGEYKTSNGPIEKMQRRLLRKSGSQRSVTGYSITVRQFLRDLGFTPEDFIEGVKSGKIDVVKVLNDYLDRCYERKLSSGSMKNYYTRVKKFIEVNLDININWKRVELPTVRPVEEDEVPKKEVIDKVLKYAEIDDKALVLVAISSGLREGTLSELTVGEVALDDYKDIGVIKVRPDKSKGKVKFITFISPEAKEILKEYFEFRKRQGENIKPESPLFAYREKGKTSFYSRGDTLALKWRRLLDKSGFDERNRKFYKYHFHTLRKFFRTALEYAGVSRSFRERLLGHKGDYLDSSYFGPQLDAMIDEYRKAIPHLTIEKRADERDMATARMLADMARLQGASKEDLENAIKLFEDGDMSIVQLQERISKIISETLDKKNEVKTIKEKDIENHLNHGWVYVGNTPSGKVIIKRG